jgi:hypothetical protein
MSRILLVTGSRALERSDREGEAKAILHAVAGAFRPSAVVAGDARGPDDWAASWADVHGCALRIYALDGWVYDERRARARLWRPVVEGEQPPTSPLARNVAMVRDIARLHARNVAAVRALGLEAEWSDTRGTAHTVARAREHGLEVTHVTFARER